MRTRYLFANLKNRLNAAQSLDLALKVRDKVGAAEGRFVGMCPSDAALAWTAGCKGDLLLAAQNCGWMAPYALTGELSAADLTLFGITYCLAGHSERRLYLNESDVIVGRRLASLLTNGLVPILCIGEGLDDRRRGGTAEILEKQLQILGKAFAQSGRDPSPDAVIVAYEPMWAISTSGSHLRLEPADAAEAHDLIRRQLDARFGPGFGEAVSVLFGGSVSEINAQAYFAHPTIDGGLVGSGMQTVEGFCGVAGAFQNS